MEGKLRFKIEKISVYGEYNFSPGGISISIIIFNPRRTTIRMLQFPVFRFQAVNDLVTELEQANITCAATITFAENDYKEQLQTLKVKNTLGLELIEFFPSRCFIYFFFLDLRHRDT